MKTKTKKKTQKTQGKRNKTSNHLSKTHKGAKRQGRRAQNGLLEASRTPLGVPQGSSRGGPGGPQEAILELLEAQGSTLDAQAAKKHSRHPKMTPKSAPKVPKYFSKCYHFGEIFLANFMI